MAVAVLGGELFGFDLKWVREFAPLPALTRVPLGPPQVKGLLNLRGEILPLLDIRLALGMDAPPPIESSGDASVQSKSQSHMEVVVVEHEGARLAIWVEQVLDVFVTSDAVVPVSARHEAAELLQGVTNYRGPNVGRFGFAEINRANLANCFASYPAEKQFSCHEKLYNQW